MNSATRTSVEPAGARHDERAAGGLLVSVVVPTYRRPELLSRCLGALIDQDLAPRRYEIIVCDDGLDGATRDTVAWIAEAARATGVAVTYVPVIATQGPAGARNCGWRKARSALVAFTDDDTIPEPDWLSAGCRAARRAHASAVSGTIRVPLPARASDYERDAAGLESAEFATANCFVTRAMLERVGGFDERYTAAWREDSDLQFAILEAGGTIVAAADAIVVHPVRPAPWGVSVRQQAKSRFDALLYKKHHRLYRQRIAGPPYRYYAIVLSGLVAPLAALSGHPRLAAAAAAAWESFIEISNPRTSCSPSRAK